jgi:HTH-type transcriptional regulator / antitoxin HipB
MIQNEHQYKVTQGEVKKLQQAVDKLLEQSASMLPVQVSAIQNSFQQQIDRMQAELREYDGLKAGKVEITMGAIEDLPKVLIQKRISLGMTQKELAEKLGIKEQMVQRYESTAYESISCQRLIEVWNALEASIPMTPVRGIPALAYAVPLDFPIRWIDDYASQGQTISQLKSEAIWMGECLKTFGREQVPTLSQKFWQFAPIKKACSR